MWFGMSYCLDTGYQEVTVSDLIQHGYKPGKKFREIFKPSSCPKDSRYLTRVLFLVPLGAGLFNRLGGSGYWSVRAGFCSADGEL